MRLRSLSGKSYCWLAVPLLVVAGSAQAGEFHYYGLPLNSNLGGGLVPGAHNRITVDVTWDANGVFSGTMSDGTHTVTAGTSGAWISCDNMQYDTAGNIVVWRCTGSLTDGNGNDFILQTNSVWDIFWVPLDDSRSQGGQQGQQWWWRNAGGGWATAGPDFRLLAAPAAQTVKAGKATQYQLTVDILGALTDIPQVTCHTIPIGAACGVTAAAGGGYIATIDTSPGKKGTTRGTYVLVFEASTPSLVHDASVSLIVK